MIAGRVSELQDAETEFSAPEVSCLLMTFRSYVMDGQMYMYKISTLL